MPKMTDADLSGLLKNRLADSLGQTGDSISMDRQDALKRYRGDLYGDEEDGRSQMVSRDVAEAIDSSMPGLLRVFASGDETVKFNPHGPEDEEQAQQATDYINHIFNQQNDGFKILYVLFKDALMQKTGTGMVEWDETEKITKETYRGLDGAQYNFLKADESLEIVEGEASE